MESDMIAMKLAIRPSHSPDLEISARCMKIADLDV
jgi:hypothetical protein